MTKLSISCTTWAPIRTTLYGSAAILCMVGIVSSVNVGYYFFKGDRNQLRNEMAQITASPDRGIISLAASYLEERMFSTDAAELQSINQQQIPVNLGGAQ